MGVAAALGIGSLAMGVMGSAASASASASQAKAQWQQAEINRKWQEFNQQMELTQQRGKMGLAEFDRLMANATLERESLQAMLAGQRALRDQQNYNWYQISRQQDTIRAKQKSTLASRGIGRGGTADAIQRQAEQDFYADMVRMRVNNRNEMEAFRSQRNQQLKQRNLRPVDQPPTYVPSTPIPAPDTSGATGQMLGAIAQGLGGLAGVAAGMGGSAGNTTQAYSNYTANTGGNSISTMAAFSGIVP